MVVLAAAGFDVIDPKSAPERKADIVFNGEGAIESVIRQDGVAATKAWLDVTAVDQKTGKTLAVGRGAAVEFDSSGKGAAKRAVASAALALAESLLPKLAGKGDASP